MVQSTHESARAAELESLAGMIAESAESAGIGILISSVQPPRHVYASPCAVSMFGRSREAILGGDPLSVFAPEEHVRVRRMAGELNETALLPQAFEVDVLRPDDTRITIEVSPSLVRVGEKPAVVSFLVDVTERKRAMESLARAQQKFQSVVESVPEAVFISRGTRLVYANAAGREVLGLSSDVTVPGLDFLEFVHADDKEELAARWSELADGELSLTESRVTGRDGRTLTLEISSIDIEYESMRSILSFCREITKRKQFEEQLMQADRLAALGMLAGGMAHAINNPLTYVMLNLEHLLRHLPDLAEGDRHAETRVRLEEAHDGAERVAGVVRRMRLFSRLKDEEASAVEVRAVLDSILGLVGNEIRHRGELVTEFADVPPVLGSEARVEQAFLSLLIFATRSLPEGSGRIRVETATDDEGRAVVTISHNGPALDEDERHRLFEPFGSDEGAALGLAVCHDVVRSLDGTLDVESSTEDGTTFRVVLQPAEDDDAVDRPTPVVPLDRETSNVERGRANVLVIDDDPRVASGLRVMLQDQHQVTAVGSAKEGLRLLLSDHDFDAVFCDLVMPDMSGIDLYYGLQLNRPGAERGIIFMTGGVFTKEAAHFLEQVENLRLEKPFNLKTVERLLQNAVRRRSRDD